MLVKDLLKDLGFKKKNEYWVLNVNTYKPQKKFFIKKNQIKL